MIPHFDSPRGNRLNNYDQEWIKAEKWDLEGTEEFEKRDLERTEGSEMGPKKCRTPVTLAKRRSPGPECR